MKKAFVLLLLGFLAVSCDGLPFDDFGRDPIDMDGGSGGGSGSGDNDRDGDRDRDRDGDKGDHRDAPCFEIVYPISYTMPDGSIIEGGSREEINMLIDMWFEENGREFDARPMRNYPIEIIYEDGTVSTINNEEEFHAALKACHDDDTDDGDLDRDDDSDDDSDEDGNTDGTFELPDSILDFIESTYPDAEIIRAVVQNGLYVVYLNNGAILYFNMDGEIQDISNG